jgi:chromosome segregation ATPase
MIPQEKHDELMEQFVRLNDRYKRIVEERDALSRQVTELRRVIAERQASGEPLGHDYKEEIRLLGKLLDDEQSLRKAAMESGVFKPSQDTYARHDRLVNVFLNIVGRDD